MTLASAYLEHVASVARGYEGALGEWDAVCVHSGSLVRKTAFDDQDWPLRAIPHFQHWLPLAEPDALLVFVPGARPRLMRTKLESFWESPHVLEADFFFESFEVSEHPSIAAMKSSLPGGKVAFIGDSAERAAELGLERNPPPLVRALDALRTKKTAYEVACVADANVRAARGHEAVRAAFFGGETSELELHLRYLNATKQDDPETPYKNIVALGNHAATLHHVSYGKTPSSARSLLLDAGATAFGYCSDITRTWVKQDDGVSSTFRSMVRNVQLMQKRLAASARVGMRYEELHDQSHREVSGILKEHGVVRASAEEVDQKGISRAFYPHGLGHSLGLQCHDVGCATIAPRPDNPFLRNTSIIEEGQLFTIEPGIYFIGSLLAKLRASENAALVDWSLVDALTPFGGVRMEDDVVVGSSTVRNLTREVLP